MDIAAEVRKASTDALKMLIRNDARAVYEDALQGCYTMFMLEELNVAMMELLRRRKKAQERVQYPDAYVSLHQTRDDEDLCALIQEPSCA